MLDTGSPALRSHHVIWAKEVLQNETHPINTNFKNPKPQSPVSFAEQVSASMNSSDGFILILHCFSEVQRMCPQGPHSAQ